jgi:hypothetical protein
MAAALAMSSTALAQTAQPDPNLPVPNPGGAPMTAPAPAAPAAPADTAAMPVQQPKMATGQFIEEQQANQTLATDLMGQKVLDGNGEQIATISDLIFDQDRRIAGVILATGGFLGIGEHNVGVELSDLEPIPDADGYVVDLSRDAIENAPAFKTLADAAAERDAEMLRQQQEAQPQGVSPAPAVPAPAPAQ